MKKLILFTILSIFFISFISATCTLTFDKTSYAPTESITAQMSCGGGNEKNQAYTINWTNQSGNQVELDTGTVPATSGENFLETFTIPSGWTLGIQVNATIQGTNLEGSDSANVTSSGTNDLVITNMLFGGGYLGLVSSIKAVVSDENSKTISGGLCKVSIWSNDVTQMVETSEGAMFNGESKFHWLLSSFNFKEGTDYKIKLICYCGSSGSNTECIDEDGVNVNNSLGIATSVFTTNTWISTSTSTDLHTMNLRQRNTISVNVTNHVGNKRIPLDITYDCRINKDNNSTRRIRSPFYFPECDSYGECTIKRGISANTTQEQSIEFFVEDHPFLQGRNTTAYCSSYVHLENIVANSLIYATTSSPFQIISSVLSLNLDWQWNSPTTLNSILNLSDPIFRDFNGTGIGDVDLIIDLEPGIEDISHALRIFNLIASITVKNLTDTLTEHIDFELEFLDNGETEIEIRNINLSKYNSNGWWNITLEFYNHILNQTISLERSATALKGIENKTGTFHLSVDCPSQGFVGSDINCSLTAYVEDPQLVQKEVDFTCYILDDESRRYSSLNFNQMITRNPLTMYRSFKIPDNFDSGPEFVLQCHADYYNLGSRRDSFYDSFTTAIAGGTDTSSGGESSEEAENRTEEERGRSPITGGAIDEEGFFSGKIKFGPLEIEKTSFWLFVPGFLSIALALFLLFKLRKRDRHSAHLPHNYSERSPIKQTITNIIAILLVLSLIAGLIVGGVYLYKSAKANLSPENEVAQAPLEVGNLEESSYILLQGNLSRSLLTIGFAILIISLIIMLFVALLILLIFRILNIKGQLSFKGSSGTREDRKLARLHNKLNRIALKNEIKQHKHRKILRIVKAHNKRNH